jgi:hypothetical protein
MVYRRNLGVLGASFQPTAQSSFYPPSVGGLNAFDSLANMPLQDAIYLYNLLPTPYGLDLRLGHVEWATGAGSEVRTVLPFEGQAADSANDRLFAVTPAGIYNVTANLTTSPSQVADFYSPEPSPYPEQAGRGVYTHFTSDASDHYMFYADGDAGLWLYDESTDTWTQQTTSEITSGIDPEDCAFVMSHKQRIWLVPKESADAYYLGVDAIAGASTKFTFGSKFAQGGTLVGLWSWSLDGGNGVDDYLVAISRSGDVLVYRGSDPAATDWAIVGSWYVGEVPNSRRITIEQGGSFYILSSYGLIDLRALMQGEDLTNEERVSPARKVSKLLAEDLRDYLDDPVWQIGQFSTDNLLMVVQPQEPSRPYEQLVQNTLTKGWCYFRDLPMLCMAEWQGRMYFGTSDGKVMLYGGNLDGTDVEGTPGQARQFEVLTAFGPLEQNAVQYKNVHHVRTLMRVAGNYKINTKAVYDFNINDRAALPGIAQATEVAIWDTDSWNLSVWGGSPVPQDLIVGDLGLGRMVAVSTRGSSSGVFQLLSWDVMYTRGGLI